MKYTTRGSSTWWMNTNLLKVHKFWEGHKLWKNIPFRFDVYLLMYLVNVKSKREIFQIFWPSYKPEVYPAPWCKDWSFELLNLISIFAQHCRLRHRQSFVKLSKSKTKKHNVVLNGSNVSNFCANHFIENKTVPRLEPVPKIVHCQFIILFFFLYLPANLGRPRPSPPWHPTWLRPP